MTISFYLHVHQPFRINNFSVFDIGHNKPYFNDERNRFYLERIIKKSYLPTNKILLDLIKKTDGKFRISLSITGVVLDQLEHYPEALKSFQNLVKTGCVEILSETYHHSLAYLYSREEFKKQVKEHKKLIKKLFNYTPTVFRNTELIYNNEMAGVVEDMGYKAILAEGWDPILDWRSPNFVYSPKGAKKIKLLLKNYRLSDDVAFRFSSREWKDWPLTAEKYINWLNKVNGNGEVVNLFMDYETFGEHQWECTGIFEFLKVFPLMAIEHPDNNFLTTSEVAKKYKSVGELDIHNILTWADTERDLSAWLGNDMQKSAIEEIYSLEEKVLATKDKKIIDDWRKLQTSDHFYYMCTKFFADGDVHKYFNPHESPYECFISFMNIINDLKLRIKKIEK